MLLLAGAGLALGGCAMRSPNSARATALCAPPLTPHLTNILYFGLSSRLVPGRVITPEIWTTFSREVLTVHFRDGMTVLDSYGEWRRPDGTHYAEPTKVVVVLFPMADARAAEAPKAVIAAAKLRFGYRSVLWEQHSVCAAF